MPPEVSQKKHTLKGVVLDNNTNEPIIGAAILVTGTGSGTTTDIDGNYQLEVPANAKSPSKTYESTDLPHGLRRDIDTIYRDIDNRVHIHLTPSAEPVYKSFISYGEKTVEIFPSVNQVVIEDMPLAGTLSLVTSVLPEGEDTKLFYSEKSLFDIGKIICDR